MKVVVPAAIVYVLTLFVKLLLFERWMVNPVPELSVQLRITVRLLAPLTTVKLDGAAGIAGTTRLAVFVYVD